MADGTALLLDRLPPDDHSTETAYASAESGDVIGADPTNTSPHDGATSEAGPEPAKREALGLWRRASFVWSPILLTFALVITYYDIVSSLVKEFTSLMWSRPANLEAGGAAGEWDNHSLWVQPIWRDSSAHHCGQHHSLQRAPLLGGGA